MTTQITRRQIRDLAIDNAKLAGGILTSKLLEASLFIFSDGRTAFAANQSMGNNRLINLANGVNAQDAVTLNQLQTAQNGISGLDPCIVVATTDITISTGGLLTIDNIILVAGDRILLNGQTDQTENGTYIVSTGAWTRTLDILQAGSLLVVTEGTQHADTQWLLSSDGDIIIGTTIIIWTYYGGLNQVVAGAGMTKTGNTINVLTASTNRIVINADNIDLALTGVTAGSYNRFNVDEYGRIISALVRTIIAGVGIVVTNGNGVNGNPTIALGLSGVIVGTYNVVTVDIYGRVVSGSNYLYPIIGQFMNGIVPTGTIDGSNTVFVIGGGSNPAQNGLSVFLNGIYQAFTTDYTYDASSGTITFITAPEINDILLVNYIEP